MAEDSQYEKYLQEKHKKFSTPENFIDQAVKEAVGQLPVSKKRLIIGEVSEVYDCKLLNEENVIVRISHHSNFDFSAEKWAIERCEKVGVPVPRILLIKHIKIAEKDIFICIQNKMRGKTLGLKNFTKKLAIKSGALLSKIHGIKTEGFGHINSEGRGNYKTFKDLIFEQVNQKDEYKTIAQNAGLSADFILNVIDILERNESYFSCDDPHLTHGDFGPKHIMVEKGEITGIIDFGDVRSGPAMLDFSWWNFFRGDSLPLEWLKEGYENKNIFDEKFDYLLHLMNLHWGLCFLYYYQSEGNIDGLNHAKKRLLEDVKFFE